MRDCCCIVCGEPIIRGLRWCHVKCATGPGWDLRRPFAEWPAWARALKRDEEQHRRLQPCDVEIVSLDALMERESDWRATRPGRPSARGEGD